MIIAEELDVDWQKVVVEMGPHDNTKLGPQFTGGSNSIRMYWKPLREAGAAARHMLREAAAQTWRVPVEEVTTKAGMLYTLGHSPGGRGGDVLVPRTCAQQYRPGTSRPRPSPPLSQSCVLRFSHFEE